MATKPHTSRMQKLLSETKGKIIAGGETDVEDRYVAPTLIRGVQWDDPLMEDELFGPVLPIITIKNVDEGIRLINTK